MRFQISFQQSHQRTGILAAIIVALFFTIVPKAEAGVRISYIPCDEPGGETVFHFSMPMVKQNELESTSHPEVVFDPEQRGTFTWRTPTELVFKPDKGFFKWGERIRMTIKKAVPLAWEAQALDYTWSRSCLMWAK